MILLAATISQTVGQVLISDDFNGSGFIDQTIWRLPFGGDGSFLGRTQLRTNLATDYPVQSGGVTTLNLDTYLDDGMGGSAGVFYGHEINTKRNFARAGGLRIEGRMRMKDIPPGLVGSFFMYDVQRTNMAGDLVRDEFDHELLTNEAQAGGQNRLLTQYWNEGPFTGPGAEGNADFAVPNITGGWDMTQFHDYRIDWLPNRLDYYVDGQLVRTATDNIPDDPMTLRFNLWAPDDDFTDAYSADLQPAMTPGENQTFGLEIDDLQVTRLNTIESDNLLVHPSFEETILDFYTFPLPPGVDEADTGAWFFFNNTFFDSDIVRTGNFSLKTFGPFTGEPNASGVWQNVDVTAGDVLEARVFAQSISTDSIAGTSNFSTIKIEFLDANGDVLGDNTKESVIFDGRDPDFPEDVWIEGAVNAIVPDNATKARLLLPMIQLENEGGAIWWDDATLVKLMADMSVNGDFNGDTFYDCTDVDALVGEIAAGTNNPDFDLTGDTFVNNDDLNAWLVEGGANNPDETDGNPFLAGDANLDGFVDGLDFIEWNANKFTTLPEWCSGDFNADGFVDGLDFIIWNSNKFTSSSGNAAVPEPGTCVLTLLALTALGMARMRH